MMRHVPPSIARDTRGVAAIEFAILLPVMLTLICGTIEAGYLYTAQTSLVGAVAQAARSSAVTQESQESVRSAVMKAAIGKAMSSFVLAADKQLTVTATTYDKFGDTFPEQYTDSNANGRYDAVAPGFVGEPFVDRNGNGVWDSALPKTANSTGEPGDVVSYVATYPVAHLFGFMTTAVGMNAGVTLTATAVVRNEPVKTE